MRYPKEPVAKKPRHKRLEPWQLHRQYQSAGYSSPTTFTRHNHVISFGAAFDTTFHSDTSAPNLSTSSMFFSSPSHTIQCIGSSASPAAARCGYHADSRCKNFHPANLWALVLSTTRFLVSLMHSYKTGVRCLRAARARIASRASKSAAMQVLFRPPTTPTPPTQGWRFRAQCGSFAAERTRWVCSILVLGLDLASYEPVCPFHAPPPHWVPRSWPSGVGPPLRLSQIHLTRAIGALLGPKDFFGLLWMILCIHLSLFYVFSVSLLLTILLHILFFDSLTLSLASFDLF